MRKVAEGGGCWRGSQEGKNERSAVDKHDAEVETKSREVDEATAQRGGGTGHVRIEQGATSADETRMMSTHHLSSVACPALWQSPFWIAKKKKKLLFPWPCTLLSLSLGDLLLLSDGDLATHGSSNSCSNSLFCMQTLRFPHRVHNRRYNFLFATEFMRVRELREQVDWFLSPLAIGGLVLAWWSLREALELYLAAAWRCDCIRFISSSFFLQVRGFVLLWFGVSGLMCLEILFLCVWIWFSYMLCGRRGYGNREGWW